MDALGELVVWENCQARPIAKEHGVIRLTYVPKSFPPARFLAPVGP